MQRTKKLFSFTVLTVFLLAAGIVSAAPPAIQTQYGSDGIEVDLIRCKVVGNVLTTVFQFRNSSAKEVSRFIKLSEVYYVANDKKFQILRDDKGGWLAAPEVANDRSYISGIAQDKPQIAWYKFPAPPEDVTRIQLNLDDITPFDEVEIQR